MPTIDRHQSRSLRRAEARTRAALLNVTAYDVALDLTLGEERFGSVTTIDFDSRGGPTFVEVQPAAVRRLELNGRRLDPDLLQGGRLPLETVPGPNRLLADAEMSYRTDGEGLHAHVDPADGRRYVYGMSFMEAASSIFACFDQPDLKAPYTLHVRAPDDWVVIGNAPAEQVERGVWELATTPPLSTYFVTLVAGPYHVLRETHDGIPLGLSARRSLAADLDADAEELFTLTRQSLDELHRLFGIRYPFGDYHQAFVPEFNAGAMENPGCVTFRDPLVFSSRVTRGMRIARASTMAHELAHQWFGNIVTPVWWDDLWLNESFAEYLGNRVTADVTEYADAWVHDSHAHRRWGLAADLRPTTHPVAGTEAPDAATALQDFDGISYTKGAAILKQLAARLGDEVFFGGVVDHLERHRFGNATMHDLFASWERAGGGDLTAFTDGWLRTAGADLLELDRSTGTVRRTPPAGGPARREHTIRVAVASPGSPWSVSDLVVGGDDAALAVGARDAVLLDAYEDTWAVTRPDPVTVAALPALLPATDDAMLRAAIWNDVRGALHDAVLLPATVLDLLEAAIPAEDNDDALFQVLPWAREDVVPLDEDPAAALARLHEVSRARLETAERGTTVQLAAFQSTASCASDVDLLQGWLDGRDLPDGLELDLDLRWRVLVRLATLGAVDRDELQRRFDAEPTARSRVEHARALASLPDAEAKAWAWRRFRGEDPVPNYELEAAGLGMWRWGQESLTGPYVDRYLSELPATSTAFSGWMLAEVAEWFFPRTALDEQTLAGAEDLSRREDLEAPQRRRVVDLAEDLRRRLAVRRAVLGRAPSGSASGSGR